MASLRPLSLEYRSRIEELGKLEEEAFNVELLQ
jgi:hypothetical protein